MTKGYTHGATPELGKASLAKAECLHMQCRRQQGRDVLDEDFSGDVQATESPSLDEVSGVVESTWVYRKDLGVVDIHVWTEKIKEHAPGSQETLLIDAGKEASKILIVQAQGAMFRSLAEYVEKVVYVTSGEMVRTCDGDELKEQASKDVQPWSEWSIHKGNDGPSTGEVLLSFSWLECSRMEVGDLSRWPTGRIDHIFD